MKRVLLVIKASGSDQSRTAIENIRMRLGTIVANNTQLNDGSWKIRQGGDVIATITIHTHDSMKIIYDWFSETAAPAPFPEGTLLFYKSIE